MLPILSSSSVHSFIPEFPCLISSSFLIVSSVVLLLPGWFFFYWLPFHLFQFLSNLPQYSWSYFLSVYPNNFFAVNLPGNSSLLNISSSLSCFLMSSISHLYSFSNFSIIFLVFPKFSLPSQVSDSTINPFYHSIRGQYLGHCLVSSEDLNLLVAYWQFMYRISIVPGFSYLYHAVQYLLFYI